MTSGSRITSWRPTPQYVQFLDALARCEEELNRWRTALAGLPEPKESDG